MIAGSIAAILGEVSTFAFEQVYLGNKTLDDVDWVKKIANMKFSSGTTEAISGILSKLSDKSSKEDVLKAIWEVVKTILPQGNAQSDRRGK